jgi:DNA-binding GntR family transcriptional regulator
VTAPAEQLADRAYFGLRDRIVDLRLPPGSTLREHALMLELGIGRTPLREAIKRLVLEHLVEVRPRRGTTVTDVHPEDIARFDEVRAALEPHAARLAAERMPDELRGEAEVLVTELEAAGEAGAAVLLRLDERIHRLAWRASCNPYLEATLEAYWALSLRVWHVVIDQVPSLPGAVHEHRALLDALLSGDGRHAEAVMREHVGALERQVLDAVVAQLPPASGRSRMRSQVPSA